MASKKSPLSKNAIIVLAFAAMAVGFWLATMLKTPDREDPSQIQGAILHTPRQIAMPELIRHDGQAFTNEELKDRWTLVFFGYTSCPDICPVTMNVLAEAKKKADDEFPQVVLVSVDPQRDSVEMLGEYVHYFDPDFIGVTGDDSMIQALTLQMSVVYMKMPGASGNENDYLVDHSSSVMMINPEGQLVAFLKAPHTPSSINESVDAVRGLY